MASIGFLIRTLPAFVETNNPDAGVWSACGPYSADRRRDDCGPRLQQISLRKDVELIRSGFFDLGRE